MEKKDNTQYRVKALGFYIISLYLVNFSKFVTSKASWKNKVDIKSVYIISSEFGFRSGKSMLKILIPEGGGVNKWEVGTSSSG